MKTKEGSVCVKVLYCCLFLKEIKIVFPWVLFFHSVFLAAVVGLEVCVRWRKAERRNWIGLILALGKRLGFDAHVLLF